MSKIIWKIFRKQIEVDAETGAIFYNKPIATGNEFFTYQEAKNFIDSQPDLIKEKLFIKLA